MPKFKVEIEEILQRVEEVEAKDVEEAIDLIDEKYDNQEIILDSEDIKGHQIREFKSKSGFTKENRSRRLSLCCSNRIIC